MKPDIAIVTGAARGIGATISTKLLADGFRVIGIDQAWSDPSRAGLSGGPVVDVSDYDAVEQAVADIEARFGPVGVIVNNAAAKAGLIAMTKSIAQETASKGITANCVAPGFIETAMTQTMRPEMRQSAIDKIPAGRVGQPEDIANTVAFLALMRPPSSQVRSSRSMVASTCPSLDRLIARLAGLQGFHTGPAWRPFHRAGSQIRKSA